MTVKARLHHAYGYEVGVGQVYGRPLYGSIGYGVKVIPGVGMFHAPYLVEIEDKVDAVVGGLYGVAQYGSFVVRQAALPGPVSGFSIRDDGAYSPEFVEDETLLFSIRPTATVAFELSEVEWQD